MSCRQTLGVRLGASPAAPSLKRFPVSPRRAASRSNRSLFGGKYTVVSACFFFDFRLYPQSANAKR